MHLCIHTAHGGSIDAQRHFASFVGQCKERPQYSPAATLLQPLRSSVATGESGHNEPVFVAQAQRLRSLTEAPAHAIREHFDGIKKRPLSRAFRFTLFFVQFNQKVLLRLFPKEIDMSRSIRNCDLRQPLICPAHAPYLSRDRYRAVVGQIPHWHRARRQQTD